MSDAHADDDEPLTDVDLKIDASALEDEGLEETKLRPASDPLLPKSPRTFTMDLPPTVPMPFPALAALRAEAAPDGQRPPETTQKLVAAPPAATAQVVVPVISAVPPRRRGIRWGRAVLLALLGMLVIAGFVKRAAVRQIVLTTTAAIRR